MLKLSLESFIARVISLILTCLVSAVYILGKNNSITLNYHSALLNILILLAFCEFTSFLFTQILKYFSRKKASELVDLHDTVLGTAKEIKE